MALVIIQQPNTLTQVYNQIPVIAYSTLWNTYNFCYRITIYVDDVSVSTNVVYPRSNGQMIFDIAPIVKNYLKNNFDTTIDDIQQNFLNETVKIDIAIAEDIDSTQSNLLITTFQDNANNGEDKAGLVMLASEKSKFRVGQQIEVNFGDTIAQTTILGIEDEYISSTFILVGVDLDYPYGDIITWAPGNGGSTTITNDNISFGNIIGWQASADWINNKRQTWSNDFVPSTHRQADLMGTRNYEITIGPKDKRVISAWQYNYDNSYYANKLKVVTNSGMNLYKLPNISHFDESNGIIHIPISRHELNNGLFLEYDDWYLPSVYDLLAMHENLYTGALMTFTDGFYWSSTWDDSRTYPYGVWFGTTDDGQIDDQFSYNTNQKVIPISDITTAANYDIGDLIADTYMIFNKVTVSPGIYKYYFVQSPDFGSGKWCSNGYGDIFTDSEVGTGRTNTDTIADITAGDYNAAISCLAQVDMIDTPIPANESGYSVQLTHDGDPTHKALNVIVGDCSKYDQYTVMYKSCYGSSWYINMFKKNTKAVDVANSNYQMYVTDTYDTHNVTAEYKTYNVGARGSITLRTDWLSTQEQVEEIMDMVKSPDICLILDNVITPVVIKSTTFEEKNKQQDRMITYEITFVEAFNKNTAI